MLLTYTLVAYNIHLLLIITCCFKLLVIPQTLWYYQKLNTTTFAGLKTAPLAAICWTEHCGNYGHAINALSFAPVPV